VGIANRLLSLHYIFNISYDKDRIVNIASDSVSVVVCVFFAAGTCLQSRYLATAVSSGSTIQDCWGDREQGHFICLLLYFQNKESRQKTLGTNVNRTPDF
jgi:hypothetical protein